jgi:hypothetical protein
MTKGGLFLHWLLTVIIILASLTSDTYTFVTNLFIYTGNWIKRKSRPIEARKSSLAERDAVFVGLGLLYLTWKRSENWKDQRTTFRSWPPLTIFWMLCLLYTIAAPFIPNKLLQAIPFYVVPVLGTGMLAVGVAYWAVWAKVLPMLGFHIQHEIMQLPDGSERVKYIVSTAAAFRRY